MEIGSKDEIISAIEKHDSIVVFHHIRPDGDCLGSQAGLYELIKDNYPNKKVYKIGNSYDNFKFLDFSFNKEEEIDFTNSLALVPDVSAFDRIENSELFASSKFKSRARIDHHEVGQNPLYEYSWVIPEYVAAAEMVAELAFYANWKISLKAAQYIYLGITTDSSRFLHSPERSNPLRLGAKLMDLGFDPSALYFNLYKKTMDDLKFQGYVLTNFKKEGKVLYLDLYNNIWEKFNLSRSQAANFVNSLANIDENLVWVFFIEEENQIRARIRSNGPAVNLIASKYTGGGHKFAAGASICTQEQKQNLISELNQAIEEYLKTQANK
ncbi:MGPA-LIKE (Mycoplasma genitalium) PROTEIN [Mycoplasmopsis pulmonis]|uniref:MGPA-LIKE (Mycoplasma genitalium) PROTEIN n=1 Tax=Mycoplasmopsis pulmonis (strain UAB CTIP) TaxID=272635 RepID=Q98RI7_MYCPU|nr:bifunctional oligoribonuclease/PAP phosphatase NrnA [Mycoplasmopsis pulmonis]MDZ7293729.1 bifunctional oligoribonuclease/PAP phosphatase NrnA [Mycoplasmopsis pulmonis]CAC13195.1 MGPA-LIKE (Mycoplasma genitalium) PROTEIN [Mycoplasmopsis pulmonis]